MIKKKPAKLKLKPRILKKNGISLSVGKQMKTKKLLTENRARNGERVRLEKVVRQQADELKIKNGELRNGAEQQIRQDEQIQVGMKEINEQREELLHVTRVGKLAEFVSSLAHEISQPLTAILSYAQAAQRMLAGKDPELEKILSYIINDDQRAAEVIQRLRSLLKKSKPEMKPLDINTLINETVMLIATDATIRNDVLKIELGSNLPFVRGDRIQLQQVVLNLISNSFDALESSQGIREILIRTSRKDAATIMVEVKDSGCGIPAQNITKLFTHFFTSKPDGLGMGLSISRSIIEWHGGRLDVKNNPECGATFYFTIPVDIKDA
jgi:two-component system sensor kinase FixL